MRKFSDNPKRHKKHKTVKKYKMVAPASFIPASFIPASFVPASFIRASFVPASFVPASFVKEFIFCVFCAFLWPNPSYSFLWLNKETK